MSYSTLIQILKYSRYIKNYIHIDSNHKSNVVFIIAAWFSVVR